MAFKFTSKFKNLFEKFKHPAQARKRRKYRLVFNNELIITVLSALMGVMLIVIFLQQLSIKSLEGRTGGLVNMYTNVTDSLRLMTRSLSSEKEKVADGERKNLTLREQVALYEEDIEEYKVKIDEYQSLLNDAKDDYSKLSDELDAEKQRYSDLEVELEEYEKAAAELKLSGITGPIMSEAYTYKGTKWNIIENYKVKKSSSTYTTEQMPIDSAYYYAIYTPGKVTIKCYSKEYSLLSTLKEDASEGLYKTFEDNVAFVTLTYSDENTYFVSTGITKVDPTAPTKGRYFFVVSPNSPVKLSMAKAVKLLTGGGTVLVLPGTYKENVSATGKKLNLIGVDREKCILVSNDMEYNNPPLEVASGKITNLTIKAENKKSKSSDLTAYAIHVDYDYTADRGLTISNCTISSDFNAGIGMGLRRGTITIQDCQIYGLTSAIFFHDCDNDVFGDKQTLKLIRCSLNSTGDGPALNMMAQCKEGSSVNLLFQNCIFRREDGKSELYRATNADGKTYSKYFLGLKGFKLDSDSQNNSLAEFNK